MTLGRVNALAVYRYGGDPQEPVSYVGLLPTTTTRPTSPRRPGPGRGDQHARRRRAGARAQLRQGSGHRARDGPRHPQHHGFADDLRPPQRQAGRGTPRGRSSPRTAGPARTSPRPPARRGRLSRPHADRRPVQDQARLPAGQGEPHLRPGLRRRGHGQRRPSLAQFGANVTPNQTRSRPVRALTTTSTTWAPTPPRATTG